MVAWVGKYARLPQAATPGQFQDENLWRREMGTFRVDSDAGAECIWRVGIELCTGSGISEQPENYRKGLLIGTS